MAREPRSTRRKFGRLRQFRSGRWKASYTGPDGLLYEAPHTFGAKEDAEAWLTDRRREIDRELWSPPATAEQKTAKRAADVKFGDYARKWVETRTVKGRPLRPRTREHYEQLLEVHIYPTFKTKAIRAITTESVDRWYARTLPDKPTIRAHTYSLLRTILETARERDRIIDVNPCLIRGAGTAERKIKPKPATVEQIGIIAAEMPDNLGLMIILASWCALRFGELVALRRNDIDLDDAIVRVRRQAVRIEGGWKLGDPKSEAGRRDVAIPPHIIPAVEGHLTKHVGPQKNALLFPAKTGEYLQPSTLYRHFYKARDKAKRPDLRFHDLRHSGAVLAAQTGATLAELMARLGHSTPQAAMRYQHAAQGRDRQIAEALSKLAATE
ncbi:integrase [Mycobacterium lentiflavum]|uniref:Integrase n=1 Tax=Mycobacterium lentiflavum TaxID=141349 RepID=A0A0E3WC34_MYCLN|nr:site-specific integrase [Mycobacterium lentiflavum]MEE3067251.1 tyrosine-type recombinase/integrase [Actinomycetota bacterium]ULP44267.1 site-specific integrase [Mycobacterium lentiflavum]CQD11843.1 integrase [Mycobacterium lentiflavum]